MLKTLDELHGCLTLFHKKQRPEGRSYVFCTAIFGALSLAKSKNLQESYCNRLHERITIRECFMGTSGSGIRGFIVGGPQNGNSHFGV